MIKSIIIAGIALLSMSSIEKQEVEHVSHASWDALLQKHVSANGNVDYDGFMDDKSKVDAYCKLLSEHIPNANWSITEKKAYWYNCYNANAIRLVLTKYPVMSINDLADKPFDKLFVSVAGRKYSLNDIEKSFIKKQLKDVRFHFAINCCAASCPKLNNKAFTKDNVNKELKRLTKEFCLSKNNTLEEKKVELSKIFEWYGAEFVAHSGSVVKYIEGVTGKTFHPKVKVSYKEYDWKLNK